MRGCKWNRRATRRQRLRHVVQYKYRLTQDRSRADAAERLRQTVWSYDTDSNAKLGLRDGMAVLERRAGDSCESSELKMPQQFPHVTCTSAPPSPVPCSLQLVLQDQSVNKKKKQETAIKSSFWRRQLPELNIKDYEITTKCKVIQGGLCMYSNT